MFGKTNDSSAMALVCYCILAMGITLQMTQSRGSSQDKSAAAGDSKVQDSGEKANAGSGVVKSGDPANGSSETESQTRETSKQKENHSAAKGSESKSGKETSPVVRINTEVAADKDSSLNFQSDTFDVVPPDWFSNTTTVGEEHVVPFYVIGFDDEQISTEKESRLKSEIDRYVDEVLGTQAHQYVVFSDAEKSKIVSREETRAGMYFDGNKQTPVDFHFAHLKFDQDFREMAKSKWIEKRQESRLFQYGLIGGASLVLLVFVFGGLRLNSATNGYYQGRLQFFVAIVILGVIAAGIYFGTQIDWL